ncbi:hypothetical protein LMG9673_04280 [Ralstonia pseudosolanacearum]|nr:hypothetical protein LMG9673_04280 [Ralstonia pseudosolanacearum]
MEKEQLMAVNIADDDKFGCDMAIAGRGVCLNYNCLVRPGNA